MEVEAWGQPTHEEGQPTHEEGQGPRKSQRLDVELGHGAHWPGHEISGSHFGSLALFPQLQSGHNCHCLEILLCI